jgi:hypothetical protein
MRRTLKKDTLFTREEFGDDLDMPFYGTFERYLIDPPKSVSDPGNRCFGFSF